MKAAHHEMPKSIKGVYASCFWRSKDKPDLIKDLGEAGYLLYEFYLRCGKAGDFMDDDKVAKEFGWSLDKTKRIRVKLQNAGYFKVIKHQVRPGWDTIWYFIGKEEVQKHAHLWTSEESAAQAKPRAQDFLLVQGVLNKTKNIVEIDTL